MKVIKRIYYQKVTLIQMLLIQNGMLIFYKIIQLN